MKTAAFGIYLLLAAIWVSFAARGDLLSEHFLSEAEPNPQRSEAEPTPQDAIRGLSETTEMLQKKSDFLVKMIATEIQNAKKHGTKNKRMAISALKRKKRLEKQLQDIDETLSSIEFQREALENANTNVEVLRTMGYAAKALIKQAHQILDVDDVHDMMDDIEEQTEVANEISDAISSPVAFQDMDEDELNAELGELEQEDLDEQILNISFTSDDLPSVPSSDIPEPDKSTAAKQEEDDDMAELNAWAM